MVSLVELGRPDQAVEFATAELAAAQRLTDRVVDSVTEPVLAALLLGKSAEAAERGVELVITEDTAIEGTVEARDLVTILGNLIDNAVDAAVDNAAARPPRVVVTAREDAGTLLLEVSDSGRGVDPSDVPDMFRRGWTTKTSGGWPVGHGLGLALVGRAVRRHGGELHVGAAPAVFTVRIPWTTDDRSAHRRGRPGRRRGAPHLRRTRRGLHRRRRRPLRCGRPALLRAHPVDVVLLDFYLPDTHGLTVCRTLRAAGHDVDVIAVTSARDLAVIRSAVSVGVVQYLLKPFTFASLRDKLDRYARFREQAVGTGEVSGQADVDGMLATLRTPDHRALPKGMSDETLQAVTDVLSRASEGLSAAAAADLTGVSRVTARRYLEYLAKNGLAHRKPHYGQVGRPEVRFYPG